MVAIRPKNWCGLTVSGYVERHSVLRLDACERRRTCMLLQFLVGGAVSVCNIAIHALVMTAVARVAQRTSSKNIRHPSVVLACVMIATVLVLMTAHTCEVAVWALAYLL